MEEDELIRVAKLANIYDFVMATPGGFDAPVGMGGSNFSGGQRQCIAIARAMMRNPDYLLLDEATSNIDTRMEKIVQSAVDELVKGRTSFVIAHRLSTIKNADVIFVMKDGDIVESGTHQELLQKQGFYYELYNSQFESEEE